MDYEATAENVILSAFFQWNYIIYNVDLSWMLVGNG